MRLLSISSDKQLFNNNSEVWKRSGEYGSLFDALHIIVFADKKEGFKPFQLSENVFVYPTNYPAKALFLCWSFHLGRAIIKREKITAITCQDPFESGLAGWLLAKIYRLPLQLQVHTDVFSPYFKAESFKNKIRALLAKFLLPRADGVRVVSERIKQSLKAENLKLKAEPVVLPIYVDVKKIKSGKIKVDLRQKYPDRSPIILMVSRLCREKNIFLAIKAMVSVVKEIPKALLLVVGDGPQREALNKQLITYNLQQNAIIEPWTDDLASYYKTADLFLLTSNYEGYGRTAIEAMAAGLPVVMTDVGLAGEILVDDLDGAIIPVGDEKALADAVLKLALNKEKAGEFRGNELKLLEKFPSKKDYLESYKKALTALI